MMMLESGFDLDCLIRFVTPNCLILQMVHSFSSFFKIFFLVVFFGLFQGLAVLPVLLSLFGPDSSFPSVDSVTQNGNFMPQLGTQSTFFNNEDQDSVMQNANLIPSATESSCIDKSERRETLTENGLDSKIENQGDSATQNVISGQQIICLKNRNISI